MKGNANIIWPVAMLATSACRGTLTTDVCDPSGHDELLAPPLHVARAPTNLLMVSIDTLRVDRIGRFGSSQLTPFLDEQLGRGVVLGDHQSCSNWTLPSALCALTGQSVTSLGTVSLDDEVPEVNSLATWLEASGFVTGLVSGNPYLSRAYPTGDDYHHEVALPFETSAADVVDEALSLYERSLDARDRPWFLHLHLTDTHSPYSPPDGYVDDPPEISYDATTWQGVDELAAAYYGLSSDDQQLVREHVQALYDGEVAYLDDQLARMWEVFDEVGALDDTLVVLWSDHGEQFWEHKRFRHGRGLYVEEVAALAAFWAPGLEPAQWPYRTNHQDLAPTILDLLGLDAPVGVSGVVVGSEPEPRVLFQHKTQSVKPAIGITQDKDRLILSWGDDPPSYFRTDIDPTESDNRFSEGEPRVKCLYEAAAGEIERMESILGWSLSW